MYVYIEVRYLSRCASYSTDLVFGSRVSEKVIDRDINVFAFLQLVEGVHEKVKIKRICSGQHKAYTMFVATDTNCEGIFLITQSTYMHIHSQKSKA